MPERTRLEPVQVEGVVLELLPRAMYRIGLDGGRLVVAHLTGSPRRNFVRVLVGDRVTVELARQDLGRGRIVRRVGV